MDYANDYAIALEINLWIKTDNSLSYQRGQVEIQFLLENKKLIVLILISESI